MTSSRPTLNLISAGSCLEFPLPFGGRYLSRSLVARLCRVSPCILSSSVKVSSTAFIKRVIMVACGFCTGVWSKGIIKCSVRWIPSQPISEMFDTCAGLLVLWYLLRRRTYRIVKMWFLSFCKDVTCEECGPWLGTGLITYIDSAKRIDIKMVRERRSVKMKDVEGYPRTRNSIQKGVQQTTKVKK